VGLQNIRKTIAEAKAVVFRKKYFRFWFDLELYVHIGAGAYICGEETALIESLERKRILVSNHHFLQFLVVVKQLW
jgi:NADH:ubiquinone oxidoreductase subunit F (NADH-binding)